MHSNLFRALWILGNLVPAVFPGISFFVNSWWGFLPTSYFFFSFAVAMLSWGALFTGWIDGKSEEPNAANVFLFSSVIAVSFAMITGHTGLLGEKFHWGYRGFLILGLLLAPRFSTRKYFFLFQNHWLNAVLLFCLSLRFFSAFIPQGHGDPLLYHLEAPRLWNLMGQVQLNHDLPVPLLAATWEYFYLWPQVLFANGAVAVKELILAQINSQWIHLLWGWWGSALVLRELLKKRSMFSFSGKFGAMDSEVWECASMLALLFVSSMQWTGALAKNDCAVAFWCLGAWLYLRDLRWQNYLFSGIFAGLAIAGKISAILFIIPLLPMIFFWHWKDKEKFLRLSFWGVIGFVLGAGPVYLRNWIETKNPFYTMFSHWFPGEWVSQSWADHFSVHQPVEGSDRVEMLWMRFHQLLKESPALWLWALLAVLFFYKPARILLMKFWDWIFLFVLSIVVCVVAVTKDAEPRYLGAALWVGAVMGVYALCVFSSFMGKRWEKLLASVAILVILACSQLPTHFLWKFFRVAPGESYVLGHTGGRAKAWLRDNIKNNELVVIAGDNETYYLSTIRSAVVTERPDIDRAIYGVKDAASYIRGICETSGSKYLFDVRDDATLMKRFPHPAWEKSILFAADGSRVFDLLKLQDLMFKKNIGCGRT